MSGTSSVLPIHSDKQPSGSGDNLVLGESQEAPQNARRCSLGWAASDWEIEDFDSDEDEALSSDLPPASSQEAADDCGKDRSDSPRPGSLLELILEEDAPTISGWATPRMRRLGSMQEIYRVRFQDDDHESSFLRLPEVKLETA